MDPLSFFENLLESGRKEVLAVGAEATVFVSELMGMEVVVKKRLTKKYLHPKLLEELVLKRTRKEARILIKAYSNGVCVPRPLLTIFSRGLIVMERIGGDRLDLFIEKELNRNSKKLELVIENVGHSLGRLHSIGIVHGDFSINNVIVDKSDNKLTVCIIDFGLSDFKEDLENRAIDLHVLYRSLSSLFPEVSENLWKSFVKGYKETEVEADTIIERWREMELRGRYVEERRVKTGIRNRE